MGFANEKADPQFELGAVRDDNRGPTSGVRAAIPERLMQLARHQAQVTDVSVELSLWSLAQYMDDRSAQLAAMFEPGGFNTRFDREARVLGARMRQLSCRIFAAVALSQRLTSNVETLGRFAERIGPRVDELMRREDALFGRIYWEDLGGSG